MKKSTKNNIIIIAMVVLLATMVIRFASGRGNFALVEEATVTETVTDAASDMPAPDIFILSSEAMTRSETADEIFDADQSDEDGSEIVGLEEDTWNLTEIDDSELNPDDDQEETEDIQEEDSEDDEHSLGENMQQDDTDSSVWHHGHDTVIWTSEDGVVHYACNTDGEYKAVENGKVMCDQDHPCEKCVYDDIMYCYGCGMHPETECVSYSCRYCGDTYCVPVPEETEEDLAEETEEIDEINPEDESESEE